MSFQNIKEQFVLNMEESSQRRYGINVGWSRMRILDTGVFCLLRIFDRRPMDKVLQLSRWKVMKACTSPSLHVWL